LDLNNRSDRDWALEGRFEIPTGRFFLFSERSDLVFLRGSFFRRRRSSRVPIRELFVFSATSSRRIIMSIKSTLIPDGRSNRYSAPIEKVRQSRHALSGAPARGSC
jgi:hypothetical protein